MNENILKVVYSKIETLKAKENYFNKDVEAIRELVEKLISAGSNIPESEIAKVNGEIDGLLANAKDDSLSISSNRFVKIPKKAAIAMGSLALVGAITISGITLSGCGNSTTATQEQEIDMDAIKDEVKAELMAEMQGEQENQVSINSTEKVLSENLSFDPNNNDELVSRMVDFIAEAWAAGVDVPVDKMMDYYLVMNLEDIDPVDYARLGYNTKTTESILSNYQYCANLFMDDLLTIEDGKTIDYSLIVADKDSALSLNTLEQKIVQMNEKTITSKDVHDYIYDTYIDLDSQRENLYNAGPNWQAYSFMFSYDELTNGKGLSDDENIILNEDRNAVCATNTVDGEKNKSDKAQEQTSIVNQLDQKLEIAFANSNQDLTNVSESERKSGIELENEITSLLKERNAVLVENPKFTGSYSYENSNITSSNNGRGSIGGGAGGESTNTIYEKLSPEEEANIQNGYTGSTTYTDNNGNAVSDADLEKAKQDAIEKAKQEAEEKAKQEAGGATTEFIKEENPTVEITETTETTDFVPIENNNKDNSNSSTTTQNSSTTTTQTPSTTTTTTVPSNDPNVVETTETIETFDYLSESASTNDLISDLYAYRDYLTNMTDSYEENSVKTI